MYNTIPDILRKEAVTSLLNTETLQRVWPIWQQEIGNYIGNNYNENSLIDLGDHLGDIFRSTGVAGRDQGALSSGGTAWESLVCWYINLCTAGSRVVAFRTMSKVPKPIQDATTINYANFACNTESDITVVVFPNAQQYNVAAPQLNISDNTGRRINPLKRNGMMNPALIDFLTEVDFAQFEVGVIQCKTNWNDNAQIPMLWDMVYSAGGFRGRNITIGRNNFTVQNLPSFTYSFATVPSNTRANYTQNSVAVKRVTNLSGGNYWGQPTQGNVAKSLKEIFTNNFASGARVTLRDDLRNGLNEFAGNGEFEYFRLL
ncbi:hypothetical protein [Sphingobacterium siyangense]|uniref:hypothetical protein n=1 Tax=Sphingobacterium siyangense TaxID=459529 RepID=UPI00301680F7